MPPPHPLYLVQETKYCLLKTVFWPVIMNRLVSIAEAVVKAQQLEQVPCCWGVETYPETFQLTPLWKLGVLLAFSLNTSWLMSEAGVSVSI